MICTICGCEMKNNGDWFACPTCGSVHFGPDPNGNKRESAPTVKKEESPVKKEEPPVKTDEPITEAAQPVENITPKPTEKQKIYDNDFLFFIKSLEEEPVKEDNFTVNETPLNDDVDASFAVVDDLGEGEPSEQAEKEETEAPQAPKEPEENAEGSEEAEKSEEPETTEDDESDEGKKEEDKKKSKLKDVVDFLLPIVAAVIIAFVLKTFIIANAKVPTGSMIETINIGDRIIASRLAYKTDTPSRYDIILFYYPDNENDIFVKRVIGLPGETLEVIDGVAYVTTQKGKTIQTEQSFVNPAETPRGNYGPYYIPEKGEVITAEGDYCFAENGMMVGHKDFLDKYCEKDGRDYVVAENLYFMLGDNRNHSSDSREWNFSYVAENKIIGKVLFKYYPSFEKIE